jgi:hypothetical protein
VGLFLALPACVPAEPEATGSVNTQGGNMKHARRTDFWFAGVAILPVVFLWMGRPEVILMLYAPLLIVACLFGLYEQKMDRAEQKLQCGAKAPMALSEAELHAAAEPECSKTAEA